MKYRPPPVGDSFTVRPMLWLHAVARRSAAATASQSGTPSASPLPNVPPWPWQRRRFRCLPRLAGAPPRRPASSGRLAAPCRASPRPRVTGASGVAYVVTSSSLAPRAPRDVVGADPVLLAGFHRPRCGRRGLVRARYLQGARCVHQHRGVVSADVMHTAGSGIRGTLLGKNGAACSAVRHGCGGMPSRPRPVPSN